jgi:hypothetical protein
MEEEAPKCACGCQQPVKRATYTNKRLGYQKGEYLRFIRGHQARLQKRNDESDFWRMVDVRSEDECWLWSGGKNPDGYGLIWFNGKRTGTHKIAFLLSGGVLTEEENQVLHRCDVRSCCNPKHLFAGSQHTNILDMEAKQRAVHPVGENSGSAKLTEVDVREIRNLYDSNQMNQAELARKYGVNFTTISSIVKRKTWTHVA